MLSATIANYEYSQVLVLVPEVPVACENHSDTVLVTGVNDLLIAPGAPRLHDGRRAGLMSRIHAIAERKERI